MIAEWCFRLRGAVLNKALLVAGFDSTAWCSEAFYSYWAAKECVLGDPAGPSAAWLLAFWASLQDAHTLPVALLRRLSA